MRKIGCGICLLFSVFFAKAQLPLLPPVQYDTTYIINHPSQLSVSGYMASRYNRFRIVNSIYGNKISYDPANRLSIGLGASYHSLSFSYSVNVGSNGNGDSAHQTKIADFMTSVYTNPHLLDFGFQLYRGYEVNPKKGLFVTPPHGDKQFRDDIRTFALGINYDYLFNFKRFSFASSFSGTQIQLRNAGSLLAGAFFNYYDLRANTSIIPEEDTAGFNEKSLISEGNIFSFGVNGGYAYTFILPKHFFATLSFTPGLLLNFGEAKSEVYYTFGHPFTASAQFTTRDAIGYNSRRIFCSLSCLFNYNYVRMGNQNQLNYNFGKINLQVTYRFDDLLEKLKRQIPLYHE